jgi:hypothetical protein
MISIPVRLATLGLSTVVALGTLLWAQPMHPAQGCSITTLHDRYGYIINGTANGNPITIVGEFAADGNGTIGGMETRSENGKISQPATLGTYKINRNCTGTLEIDPAGGSREHFALSVTSAGKEIEMLETDAGTTEEGTAQAKDTRACATAGLSGGFGLLGTGTEIGVGPLAFAGQIRFHGDGTLNGTETVSINGSISSPLKITGAYKVGKKCFGGAVLHVDHNPPIHLNVVVVKAQKRVLFIQTDANSVVSGSVQR